MAAVRGRPNDQVLVQDTLLPSHGFFALLLYVTISLARRKGCDVSPGKDVEKGVITRSEVIFVVGVGRDRDTMTSMIFRCFFLQTDTHPHPSTFAHDSFISPYSGFQCLHVANPSLGAS